MILLLLGDGGGGVRGGITMQLWLLMLPVVVVISTSRYYPDFIHMGADALLRLLMWFSRIECGLCSCANGGCTSAAELHVEKAQG